MCCVWDGLSASADVTVIVLLSAFLLDILELDKLSFCCACWSNDSCEMKAIVKWYYKRFWEDKLTDFRDCIEASICIKDDAMAWWCARENIEFEGEM